MSNSISIDSMNEPENNNNKKIVLYTQRSEKYQYLGFNGFLPMTLFHLYYHKALFLQGFLNLSKQ